MDSLTTRSGYGGGLGDDRKDADDHGSGQDPYGSIPPPDSNDPATMNMEATLNVMRDSVTGIADVALRSVAEALAAFGVSPTVFGYTEEEFYEMEEVDGSRRAQRDEVLQKSSFSRRTEENVSNRRKVDEDAVPGGEAGSGGGGTGPEEGSGIARTASWVGGGGEEEITYEDKKDK